MDFKGPPEALLERCAAKIEREAHPKDRADLLAVSQVLTGLRFPDPELLKYLGGEETMIESPVLQKMIAKRAQEMILEVLKDRFKTVPREVTDLLRAEINEKKLKKLNVLSAKCLDIQAFRDALLS